MSKAGDRVKFIHDNRRPCAGILVAIVPADQSPLFSEVCSQSFHGLVKTHDFRFSVNPINHLRLQNLPSQTYLVSIMADKFAARPRSLYRPRRVELCEPDDKRDGVYPMEQGE